VKYAIKLNNSILGWTLVPTTEDAKEVLSMLYGEDYDGMKPSDRAFHNGQPVAAAKAHLVEVCKGMGVSLSFCGKPFSPTVNLWHKPRAAAPKPEPVSVDLKWSCWSVDDSLWQELAPGVWERMRLAWTGDAAPVKISTGPRKEIRYGSVTISKGRADGYFVTEWDDAETLADTLGTEYNDAFNQMIPYSMYTMEPGMHREFAVKAKSFGKLMERIDAEEDALLAEDSREWAFIKSCFDGSAVE
jgi:hypothetical protein